MRTEEPGYETEKSSWCKICSKDTGQGILGLIDKGWRKKGNLP